MVASEGAGLGVMYAKRVDKFQPEMCQYLRRRGASVHVLSSVGAGLPDLLVGWHGRNLLVELKSPKGRLTLAQRKWIAEWRGQVAVVKSVEELEELLNVHTA